MHLFDQDRKHLASRLLPAPRVDGTFRFLDPGAKSIQVVVRPSPNSANLETIHFDRMSDDPVKGAPPSLLEEWQREVGLTINVDGEIVARTPLSVGEEKPK